jgi:hypothetical protein
MNLQIRDNEGPCKKKMATISITGRNGGAQECGRWFNQTWLNGRRLNGRRFNGLRFNGRMDAL